MKTIRSLKLGQHFTFCGYVFFRGSYNRHFRVYTCPYVLKDGSLSSEYCDFYGSEVVDLV